MRRLMLLLTVCVGYAVSMAAAASGPVQLAVSDLQTSAGKLTKLHGGVTYGARLFPLALRFVPPDGSWTGSQWRSGRLPSEQAERLGIKDEGGPPHFGWVGIARGGTSKIVDPRGIIVIMTAYARTPSLAATVKGLLTRGHGAIYEPTTSVRIAGFAGAQFDGKRILTAPNHVFVPFSPISHGGGAFPSKLDALSIVGSVFRVIVLNVRGKTVVMFIDSVALSADEFPAFLTRADRILKSLRFSA